MFDSFWGHIFLIVQWTEHRFPKSEMEIRFLLRKHIPRSANGRLRLFESLNGGSTPSLGTSLTNKL